MRILISNDDGVHAPGISVLAQTLSQIAEVMVVAPDRNYSGASSSLTLESPLRVTKLENGFLSVKGTPTDCVHLAIDSLLPWEPDLVVSGINAGANLGDDTIYSGTVAAAIEGRHLGLPAVAVSLCGRELSHYQSAAEVVRDLLPHLARCDLPADQLLNVNVPDLPRERLQGIQVTRLGSRHRAEGVIQELDPRGQPIYWVAPPGAEQDAGPGTDFYAIAQGYVSITPLRVDLTAHESIKRTDKWLQSLQLPSTTKSEM